jgi:hypothetical protein
MHQRNNQYGPPTQDFDRTAGILNALGYRGPGGRQISSHDVAVIQIGVKLSRLTWSPGKLDSWVDVAGYAACGYECAECQAEGNLRLTTVDQLRILPVGMEVEVYDGQDWRTYKKVNEGMWATGAENPITAVLLLARGDGSVVIR